MPEKSDLECLSDQITATRNRSSDILDSRRAELRSMANGFVAKIADELRTVAGIRLLEDKPNRADKDIMVALESPIGTIHLDAPVIEVSGGHGWFDIRVYVTHSPEGGGADLNLGRLDERIHFQAIQGGLVWNSGDLVRPVLEYGSIARNIVAYMDRTAREYIRGQTLSHAVQ